MVCSPDKTWRDGCRELFHSEFPPGPAWRPWGKTQSEWFSPPCECCCPGSCSGISQCPPSRASCQVLLIIFHETPFQFQLYDLTVRIIEHGVRGDILDDVIFLPDLLLLLQQSLLLPLKTPSPESLWGKNLKIQLLMSRTLPGRSVLVYCSFS